MGEKRRVLLKLSGEAFGAGSLGVNPDVVSEIAKDIAKAAEKVEIAIVVGGGNFLYIRAYLFQALAQKR
jgi:uridylate kinase